MNMEKGRIRMADSETTVCMEIVEKSIFPFSDTIYCESLGLEVHVGDTLGVGIKHNVCGSQYS